MTGETKFIHQYSTKYSHVFEVWIDNVSWGEIFIHRIMDDDSSEQSIKTEEN